MPNLTVPMALFASNYLAGSVSLGNFHLIAAALGLVLLAATLGLILNIKPSERRRPRLVASRPAMQH